jgi:hypothetical protein
MTLSFISAVITVFSVFKMIKIIKELGSDYNTPKLIVHALLVVIQTVSVGLLNFADDARCFEVVVATDFIC